MKRAETFIFEKIEFKTGEINFHYLIDGKTYIYSTFHNNDFILTGNDLLLVTAQIGLAYMIDLLIVTLPKEIDIQVIKLTEEALKFWKLNYKRWFIRTLIGGKITNRTNRR